MFEEKEGQRPIKFKGTKFPKAKYGLAISIIILLIVLYLDLTGEF